METLLEKNWTWFISKANEIVLPHFKAVDELFNVHDIQYEIVNECGEMCRKTAGQYYSEYVESIRGLIHASEFEMHVTYLHRVPINDFEMYKEKLLATATDNHKKVREKFWEYVEVLRSGIITRDEFEIHSSRLREYNNVEIDKTEAHKHRILLNETKKYFWTVVPVSGDIYILENKSVEHIYGILSKIDYENATLCEVLRPLGLLELIDDCNIELLNVLKKMLFYYHPDRNKHYKSQEIFMLINEYVYNPVRIIFEDFEKYTNCSYASCQLDEFLTWEIREIKEIREVEKTSMQQNLQQKETKLLAVYNHLLSKVEPEGDFGFSVLDERFKWQRPVGSFRMDNYRKEKADILNEKDKILIDTRELLINYFLLSKLNMLYMETKLRNVEQEIKYHKKSIKKQKSVLKEEKERIKALIAHFVPLFEPMIEKYKREINYLKDVCAGKVSFEEKWKVRFEWDEEEREKCDKKIKKAKLNTFVDERRLNLYQERIKELKEEKEVMESLLDHLNKEIERKSKGYFAKMKDKVLCSRKSYNNCISACQKHAASEYISLINEFEGLRERIKVLQNEQEFADLFDEFVNFMNKFKTEKEKYDLQSCNKVQDKNELLALIKERKQADMEAREEKKAKEEAEAKSKCFQKLLLQIKNGKISLSELRKIDIESLGSSITKPII